MSHHIELAQGSRTGVPFGAPNFIDGGERLCETLQIEWLGAQGCSELNRSQFVRLSQELERRFPDFRGAQVRRLKDLCLVANHSEEFFLSVSKCQWLRTVITCNKHPKAFFSKEAIQQPCTTHISSITIRSIVVPCHPYWPKLQAVRDEAAREFASKRLYFPSTFLEAAVSEDKSLVEKLNEWDEKEAQCAIANQLHETDGDEETSSRPFWNIRPDDVQVQNRNFGSGSQANVCKISWRGGLFARKLFKRKDTFDTELEVVLRLSHPQVVYSFGMSMSTDEKQLSLLMELLDRDLDLLIEDRVRERGRSESPFSRLDSLDILLQIARAMAHMHELAEPVIHGDLKPKNILVSECEVLGDVRQFLVKVADFGSARILKLNSSSVFNPGGGTTMYAAPELLEKKLFPERNVEIEFPKKIDVYSFGIIAFQVLTGLVPYEKLRSLLVAEEGVPGLVPYQGVSNRQALKEGVVAGNLRPPLREACGRPNFWNDPDLMRLVQSCWHREPSARPEFSEVTTWLESIYCTLDQDTINGAHAIPPTQDDAADDGLVQPQANATAANDEPQVSGLPSVHGMSKTGSRKRGFRFLKMLNCARISPGNVAD